MQNRSDITQAEVFISWTGKDRALKDHYAGLLKNAGISCKESDESCSGDYRQWSREAVGACGIVLLILTENALNSRYIPMELDALRELEDHQNRIVPVCTDRALYAGCPWGLQDYASAVFLNEGDPDAATLHKIHDLLTNRMDRLYRAASAPDYMRLAPLLSSLRITDREYDFSKLYIPRRLTELDEQGLDGNTFDSPARLLAQDGIVFIHGPGGSGKTQYISQIREAVGADTLVFSLSCSKLAGSEGDLFESLFREFSRLCGNREYYTQESFRRLLSVRQTVLVLDGLDEISTRDGTRSFLNTVAEYYVPNMTRTTLIFTSRNSRDSELIAMGGKAVRRFRLDKLQEAEIRELGESLFLLFGSRERSTDFYISAQSLSDEIRTNPLLLSQLAIVYQDSGNLPRTEIGIWDAISEITFRQDSGRNLTQIPPAYADMVRDLPDILKVFSQERYRLLSQGKRKDAEKILSHVLKDRYGAESRSRAAFLLEYLQNRAILVQGEFYHKMFLEYFTAVYYYEQSFDDYDEIEDADVITELFSHYSDPYWAQVLKLYLMKADSRIEEDISAELYETILRGGIREYTLLLDTAKDLECHREAVQLALVTDILEKSTDGTYPAYGPLFWYVPEFGLYEAAVLAAAELGGGKALALTRDVCVILGQLDSLDRITDRVDGKALYRAAKPELSGVRDALCALFCTGHTDFQAGADIYPRCFNVLEAKTFLYAGCGTAGKMTVPFADELELYSHESYPALAGEYIGMISCPYDRTVMEQKLNEKPCRKLRGLILTPTEDTVLDYVAFDRTAIRVFYIPENITKLAKNRTRFMPLIQDFAMGHYFRDRLTISGVDKVPDYALSNCPTLKTLVVDDGVAEIGKKAFWGCENLSEVSLPESLRILGERAFFWCGNLKRVHLPHGLTAIGPQAFANCNKLEEVFIPGTVETIDREAFANCPMLCRVTMEEGLRQIGIGAFTRCDGIRALQIPDSVTRIDAHAFAYCWELTQIRLPKNLKKLSYMLFNGCWKLETIEIPDSVTNADSFVFDTCTSLKQVQLSENLTCISSMMFSGCSNLETIHIPDRVTRIENFAFAHCSKLRHVRLPDSLLKIEGNSFYGCAALENLILPDGIRSIGINCFKECSGLTRIYLPKSLREISAGCFTGCQGLERVHISEGIAEIELEAFRDCTALREIHLPDSLNAIWNQAFQGCRSLTAIDFPQNLQAILDEAFADCEALNDVVLPASVLQVGENIFRGCTGLTRLTVPHWLRDQDFGIPIEPMLLPTETGHFLAVPTGTVEISKEAYRGRTDLERVLLPAGVEVLGDGAFANCPNLISVELNPELRVIGSNAFRSCIELEEIRIPEGVTTIEANAFRDCGKLKKVWLPDSVTSIGRFAFGNCTALTEIRLPAELEVLPSGIFHNCTALESIQLPQTLEVVEPMAFHSCSALTAIAIPDSVCIMEGTHYCSIFGNCSALREAVLPRHLTALPAELFQNCTALERVVLPEKLTEISKNAFIHCSSLKQIKIPAGVTRIDSDAFRNCTGLERIDLPDSITGLGQACFFNTGLREVRLPHGLREVAPYCFSRCNRLIRVEIGGSVTEIMHDAFTQCPALEEVVLPPSVTRIQSNAFAQCASLRRIDLPDSIIEIASGAFAQCASLTELVLPKNLTEVASYTFNGCCRLRSVILPEGLTAIYRSAFQSCGALEEIRIPIRVLRIDRDAFFGCLKLRSVTISANFRKEIGTIFGTDHPEIPIELDPGIFHFI